MNADISLFGWDQPLAPRKAKRNQPKGNAAPIGSGPSGETCGSCKHAKCRVFAKRNWKCALVKATGVPGTDIRLKWAACSRWEAKA
jgi:hypothetical protein